jgi:uncharacterized damage-inducible protein DinB
MKYLGMLALAALLTPVAAGAQDSATIPNPITTLIKQQVVRYGQLQVAAGQAMPEDKYTYRSTPETRTFAQLMLHVAQFNNNMCARISGMTAPDIKDLKETDGKDKLVEALKASFDFCATALAKVDDSKLGDEIELFGGRKGPRAFAMIVLTNDWADHYSSAAMYLRLNGLLPPTAQPKK